METKVIERLKRYYDNRDNQVCHLLQSIQSLNTNEANELIAKMITSQNIINELESLLKPRMVESMKELTLWGDILNV